MNDSVKRPRPRMDIMDDFLASIGQCRKPIPNDGSSLFRSVSEQLFLTQVHHVKVRESCVDHMRRHKKDFEDFMEIPFDDYLERMSNTKEWGDQLEISALSRHYRCDFYIYEQPGQAAKNVTENLFEKKIYLCHSGQKHYDCVYPSKYFTDFGICQSIVNSILLIKVFGVNKTEERKLVKTFRMLSCSYGDAQKDKKTKNQFDSYPLPSVYEPSIGNVDPYTPIELQYGLAYQLPFSLDFIRSLDPSVCRNIEYDFWITIKRKHPFIDSSISEGVRYCIGDRCLVCLNIYSKPLCGHVQEISPYNGPITVFLEALVGMHTVAVKNVKPLDFGGNSGGGDWNNRLRRRSGDGNWNMRNKSVQRYSKHSSRNDKGSFSRYNDGNRRFDDERSCSKTDTIQQKRYKDTYENNHYRKHRRNLNEKWDFNKNWSKEDHGIGNKLRSKQFTSNFQRYKRLHAQQYSTDPSRMISQLSIGRDEEETWPQINGDFTDSDVPIPPFPGNTLEWSEGSAVSTYGQQHQEEFQPQNSPAEEQEVYVPEHEIWDQSDVALCSSYDCDQQGSSANVENSPPNGVGFDDEQAFVMSPCENTTTSDVSYQTPLDPKNEVPLDSLVQPAEEFASYGTPIESPYATIPPSGVAPPRPICTPYRGTITVVDCEGKEVLVVDDKNPFQYFYNLGIEFYRHINSGNPRTVPVVYGPSVPSNVYGSPPAMQPPPMGYMTPPGTPQFVGPSVAQTGNCLPMHYFQPIVNPSQGSAVQLPVPPGHVLVHIPPPAPRPLMPHAISIPNTDHLQDAPLTDELVSSRESYDGNGQVCIPQGSSLRPCYPFMG